MSRRLPHSVFSSKRAALMLGLFLVAAWLAGGCAYPRSDTPPKPLVDAGKISIAAELYPEGEGWPEARWWRAYNSPQLNYLVEEALRGSPTLAVAEQRAEVTKAQVELARANQYPMVGGMAEIGRTHVSSQGFLSPFAVDAPLLGMTGPWYATGTVGLATSYEIDVWGKNYSQVRSALGASEAALAEKAQAELLIAAAVAQIYWDLQTLMALEAVLEEARGIEALVLSAERAREGTGINARTETELARAELEKMEVQLAAVRGGQAAARAALKGMLGLETELPEIRAFPLPEVRGRMPRSLGFELLVRRPDLQAARWYIESSLGAVDAARAAFYPSFDIMVFLGLDAIHIDKLFRTDATQFNLIGGLKLPIFDAGRLNANLKMVRAESDLSIVAYNAAVTKAVEEVAGGAARLQGLERQNARQAQAITGLKFAADSARAHYEAGLIDKAAAARARLPLLVERGQGIKLKGDWLDAEIGLIKALGGGYQAARTKAEAKNARAPADAELEAKLK